MTRKDDSIHPKKLLSLEFSYVPHLRKRVIPGYRIVRVRIDKSRNIQISILEPSGRTVQIDLRTFRKVYEEGRILWMKRDINLAKIVAPPKKSLPED